MLLLKPIRLTGRKPYEVIRDRVWSGFEDIAHHREKMVAAKSWWFPMD